MSKPEHPNVAAMGGPAAARGYTLIELLATLAVLVVSLALALPALSGVARSSRLESAQSELAASQRLGRSEAARRAIPVGLLAQAAEAGAYARNWGAGVDAPRTGPPGGGGLALDGASGFAISRPKPATVCSGAARADGPGAGSLAAVDASAATACP